VLIVGGGAAGEAAATTLRFHGYEGPVRILSAEHDLPPDRPNLSKDYLAGIAPAEWVPIRSASYYRQHGIELLLNTPVAALDTASQKSAQPMAGSSPTVRFCSPPALNP
jgi:NADPH-dependent 2,4-dienoyl-CoA reductase/sulfur reductase-like enzyme